MATTTCPKDGPLTPLDIVNLVDYDIARGCVLTTRCCRQCGEPVVAA